VIKVFEKMTRGWYGKFEKIWLVVEKYEIF